MLDNLIKELKFNKGSSPPSRNKSPERFRESPSNSNTFSSDNFKSKAPVAAAPSNAGKSSGAWSKVDNKPSVAAVSAPQTDQFESFEDYLNAPVSFEKGGHSVEKRWVRAEKENSMAACVSKKADPEFDDSLDSLFDAPAPKPQSPSKSKVPVAATTEVSKSSDIAMTRDVASQLSVKSLKDQLKAKGLKVTGNKEELVNRLIGQ